MNGARASSDPGIQSRRRAEVCATDEPQPLVLDALHQGSSAIAGAIVHNNHFNLLYVLFERGVDSFYKRGDVVDSHDHADPGS
ncbi:MAG: hypothetical protein QM757_07775 [Paludibaculum sp.]